MRHNIFRAVLFAASIFACCCAAFAVDNGIGTDDRPRKFELQVGQFDKLKLTDNANVVYRNLPDSSGMAVFYGAEEFADAFIFSEKNGTLRIQVNTEDVGKPNLPTVYVYSDFITLVENASDFTLRVESMAPCPEFKAVEMGNGSVIVDDVKANKVSATLNTGNGTLNLSGQCAQATYKMIGTGLIQADLLQADRVNCWILGSGSIGCWPLEQLSVKGIGSTKIYYKGAPEIKKTGGAKLIPIPEKDIDGAAVTLGYEDSGNDSESYGEAADNEADNEAADEAADDEVENE